MRRKNPTTCKRCGIILNEENWSIGCKRNRLYYCKECNVKRTTERAKELRMEIFKLYGNKCKICGFKDKRALQIDHINGGGCKDIHTYDPITRYLKILKNPKDYQLLCANCNQIKKYENGEFPNR